VPKYHLKYTSVSLIYSPRKAVKTCGENQARLAVPHGWSAPVG
jgi:hypothetical protein